jgi:hypothetical protein
MKSDRWARRKRAFAHPTRRALQPRHRLGSFLAPQRFVWVATIATLI